MKKTVLALLLVAASGAMPALAQDHVLGILRVTGANVVIDTVQLQTPGGTFMVPTPNFGGPSPLTDTADLGQHQFPSQGVQVWWLSDNVRQFVWGERSPVPDSMYAMLDSAGQTVGVIKFVMGQGGVEEGRTAQQPRLSVSPNPFSTRGTINWTLAEAGNARLEVFDATGQLVRTLVEGRLAAGRQSATWNGLDNDGTRVGTGIYLARLTTDTGRTLAKLILTD